MALRFTNPHTLLHTRATPSISLPADTQDATGVVGQPAEQPSTVCAAVPTANPNPMPAHRSSTRPLFHLSDRVFGRPLCVTQEKADVIVAVLAPRLGLGLELGPVTVPLAWQDDDPEERSDSEDDEPEKPYDLVNGIATIPIYGTLVKRGAWIGSYSGMTSYQGLTTAISAALTDADVKGIVYDIDSPGGESDGMFELANLMLSVRASKPSIAVCSGQMCSAAYALGCCADSIYTSITGMVGSIGCFMLHVDRSGYDKQAGLKYTYIQAGDHKTDGNPHEPLSKSAKTVMQAEVDRIRDMFVTHVALARGVTAQQVLDTQAGVVFGPAACPLLADKMGCCNDAVTDLMDRLGIDPPNDNDDLTDVTDDIDTDPPGDRMLDALQDSINTELGIAASAIDITAVSNPVTASFQLAKSFGIPVSARTLSKSRTSEYVCDSDFIRLSAGRSDTYIYPDAISEQLFGQRGVCLAVRRTHGLERRSTVDPTDFSSRQISMLVVPYDGSLSHNLGGFVEQYQPGCFSTGLSSADPRALFNHDEMYVLGRKSAGTARFWEDEQGVHVEADVPLTSWADDLLVSMRRGDITQSSAAFWILQQRWETRSDARGEKFKVRVVEKALLRDGSVLAFPAYENTTASAQPPVQSDSSSSQSQASVVVPSCTELLGARLRLLKMR